MKKIFLFALAALALGFTGCVEDEPYAGIGSVGQNPGAVTPTDEVTVTAMVIGIDDVNLIYTVNGGAPQTVAMTMVDLSAAIVMYSGPGTLFTGKIPAQADGAKVVWYVEAGGHKSAAKEYTVSAVVIDYSTLVLNEINGNDDADGSLGKSIELYNSGDTEIPLEGVQLIKNDTGEWWTGTSETKIAAKGYIVISQTGTAPLKGASGISPKQNLRFELKDPNGTVLSSFLRGDAGALGEGISDTAGSGKDQSFQRCPNGSGDWKLATLTEGGANPASGADIPQQ